MSDVRWMVARGVRMRSDARDFGGSRLDIDLPRYAHAYTADGVLLCDPPWQLAEGPPPCSRRALCPDCLAIVTTPATDGPTTPEAP